MWKPFVLLTPWVGLLSEQKNNMSKKEITIASHDIRSFFKRWPNFYYFIATVFGPLFFCGLSAKKFLLKYPKAGLTLNLGSGPRVLGSAVTNVDIYPYPEVSVIASLTNLPFGAGKVERIICDNVLEHVENPVKAVEEMHRVLCSGGVAYISTPFLYAFHSSPDDFQRWSTEGLRALFCDFEMVEIGTRAGMFSALDTHLCYIFATLFSFGSKTVQAFLVNIFMFVFWPIKLLDAVFNYWPRTSDAAALLYCVIRKK